MNTALSLQPGDVPALSVGASKDEISVQFFVVVVVVFLHTSVLKNTLVSSVSKKHSC